MATLGEQLADFLLSLRYYDLPADVRRLARLSTLDNVGVILAGHGTESARIAREVALSWGGTAQATIFGSPHRVPVHAAAFANGVADHSVELDDHIAHTHSLNHPGVVAFPAAFALAEHGHASGRALLLAAVVGYEMQSRLNATVPPAFFNFQRGFHGTAICGPFGAAAVAAVLWGLNPAQLANAFGICGSMCSGSFEFNLTGSWTKRLHAGWAAQAGIIAADMARRGFTGPLSILEGKNGFLRAHAGEGNYDESVLVRSLGHDFEFRYIMYKPFACAGVIHSPITATLKAVEAADVRPHQVEEVRVVTSGKLLSQFAEPLERKARPQTTVDAQFSLPYSVAVAICRGRALLDEYNDEAIRDPEILDMAARVRCTSDPDIDRRWPQEEPSEVHIRLKSGQVVRGAVACAKGSLGDPMTEPELKEKFRLLTGRSLSAGRVEELVEVLDNVENLADVATLLALVRT